VDNDGDGYTDCADPNCAGDPICDESLNCTDGVDNDLDGATDCDDTDCSAVACGAPSAVCESITRQLETDGTLTVYWNEVAGGSTSGGDCCSIDVGIRRPGLPYTESISFTEADVATSPNVVYAKVTQSDGQLIYCTGYVTVEPAPCPSPVLIGALSRKTHGTTSPIDCDIDVGSGEIECRSAQLGTANPNELKIVANFDPALTPEIDLLGGADVITDNGVIAAVTKTGPTTLEIDVADLGDRGDPTLSTFNTQVNLAFPGVICLGDPSTTSDSTLCIVVIVGDYDALGRTNFIDFSKVKADGYINALVNDCAIARADFDCSGRVNFIDFSKVKAAGLINKTAPACPVPPIGP
jgi:hypothetical protein